MQDKTSNNLTETQRNGYTTCADCGGTVEHESEWLGEDAELNAWRRRQRKAEATGDRVAAAVAAQWVRYWQRRLS